MTGVADNTLQILQDGLENKMSIIGQLVAQRQSVTATMNWPTGMSNLAKKRLAWTEKWPNTKVETTPYTWSTKVFITVDQDPVFRYIVR